MNSPSFFIAWTLFNKLAQPHTVEEIQADVAALSYLIYSYACKDELLEELLDGSTTEARRSWIYVAFKAGRVKLAENRAELEQLHAKLHVPYSFSHKHSGR